MIKKKLAALIDVKSIVTIALVLILCIVTLKQMPVPELFQTALMLVLGFFFGKAQQPTKNNTVDEREER